MNKLKTIILGICVGSAFCGTLEARWTTPVMISNHTSDQPNLAFDISGNAICVWQGFDGKNFTINSSQKNYGEKWTPSYLISEYGMNLQTPDVSLDRFGNAVAVWSTFDGSHSIIQSSMLPLGGNWSEPVTLSNKGDNADSPKLAMDALGNVGNAVAVWHRYNGSNFTVQSASLYARGDWSPAVNITPSGEDAFIPNIAVDSSGNHVITCCSFDGKYFTTRSASGIFGQSSGPSSVVSVPSTTPSFPKVVVTPSGKAIAVWNQFVGKHFGIHVSTMPFGGSWSSPVDISTHGQHAFNPTVGVNQSGEAIVAWTRYNGTHYVAQVSLLLKGTWTQPETLSDPNQDVTYVQAAIDSYGNALVVWDEFDGKNSSVNSSSKLKAEKWIRSAVSTYGENAYHPHLSMDPSGNAIAVWLEYNGTTYVLASSDLSTEDRLIGSL